jgi:hypothetical protein
MTHADQSRQRVMSDGRRHAKRGSAAGDGADEIRLKADHRSAPVVHQGSGFRIVFLDLPPSAVYVRLKFFFGTTGEVRAGCQA